MLFFVLESQIKITIIPPMSEMCKIQLPSPLIHRWCGAVRCGAVVSGREHPAA